MLDFATHTMVSTVHIKYSLKTLHSFNNLLDIIAIPPMELVVI